MPVILKPLRRFSQNFLVDKNIIAKIIKSVAVSAADTVLEIGPGRGALTSELARSAPRLLAVELDRGLGQLLRRKFPDFQNVEIISADILKFDLRRRLKQRGIKKVKVISNLPYHITTPILEYLFKNIFFIEDIFLTVQQELAQRLSARPKTKDYGSLTCFVNHFCRPDILFKIKAGSFWPVPKVDSCFIRLRPLEPEERGYTLRSKTLFFELIRAGFSQRRKRLYAALSKRFGRDLLFSLSSPGLLARRAEELTLSDFASLSNLICASVTKRR